MEIKDLSDSELKEQITLYRNRIETLTRYKSDTEDSATRMGMDFQLERYKESLQNLLQERKSRLKTSSVNEEKLTTILDNGIKAKRQGNYSRALDHYSKAQEIDPLDSRSYQNSMKVLIGTGKYELAFRNLLILCHFNIIQRLFNQDPIAEQTFLQYLFRFQWSSNKVTDAQIKLTNSQTYEPTLVYVGLKKNDSLKDLIYRADNLTFYMGHCYVGELKNSNDSILEQLGKNSRPFKNLNNSVLGTPSGNDFRGSSEEGYFLSIGFIYAHLNINFSLKSEEEIVQYYLNPDNKIRKDIWNYRQFIDS